MATIITCDYCKKELNPKKDIIEGKLENSYYLQYGTLNITISIVHLDSGIDGRERTTRKPKDCCMECFTKVLLK